MSSFAWWDARVAFWNTIEILLAKLKKTIWTLTKTKLFRKQSASLKEKWWRYFQCYSNVLTVRSNGQRRIEAFAQKKNVTSQRRCAKSGRIWSFSGLYLPGFGLNTDLKNSKYGHFSRSETVNCFPRKFTVL